MKHPISLLKRSLSALALATLAACGGGGGGDSPSELPNANNLAPSNVKLMEVSSNAVGAVNASWLAATDDATPAGNITYELHASESATFTPSDSTRLFSGKGITSAEVTQGVKPGVRYYIVLRAVDGQGAGANSAPLDLTVSNTAATPVAGAVVQNVSPSQINQVSTSQVVLQAGVTAPTVGGFIASTEANNGSGFLRKVTAVTSGSSGVVVTTAPASVSEVYSDLRIASTFNLDTVPAEVATNSSQVGVLVRSASADASVQTLEWPQSRFRYSAQVQPSRESAKQAGLVVTAGFRASDDKSEYGSGKWGQVTGESRIELEAGSGGQMALSLFITSNDKPLTSNTKVTVCKVDIGSVSNDDAKARKDLLSVTTGTFTVKETLTDSVPRITHAEQVIKFAAKEGADAAKPYRVVATAYLDDAGDGCTGANLGSIWREAIEFAFDVYVTADSFPSQEATEEEFSSSANFKIRNRVVTTFSPKLVFDKEIANSKLSSAKILVSARPKVEQTLTINADAQATVNATRTVLKQRNFRKIYVTPAGIPIVISGSFKIDLKIEGEATGEMTATERLEIGYDEVTFGVEYVNGQFRPVKSATPVYELKIGGEANAQANLKLTLLPSLELTAYEVLTGNVVLAPYMQATAGIEGKVSLDARVDFEADRLRTAADADYRLTAARLQGGVDTYLYADLSVWDLTIAKYPNKDAEKGKYDTYQKITLIEDTTLMDLPTLSVQVPELASDGTSVAHPTDTRALKIVASAANFPNPLHARFPGLPASFTPWRAWTALKIVDQIDIDKSTYRVVGDGAEWGDVAWATFTQPGTYTVRVGGYSAWGPWARQYEEIEIDIIDSDNNGIPDWWQQRYQLSGSGAVLASADPDRDGLSNLKEWQDGTDPKVPNGPTLSDPTLVASKQTLTLGEQFQVWISQAWDSVVRVVYTIGGETATVLRKASDTLDRAFQTTGEAAETGTFIMRADLYNSANAKVGSTSLDITVNPAAVVAVAISSAYDDRVTPSVGIQHQGTTEDNTPVIRGTLSAAAPSGYQVRLFKGNDADSFGVATLDGLNWSFTVPSGQALAAGTHSFTAGLVLAVDGSTAMGVRSSAYVFTVRTGAATTPTSKLPHTGITASQCYSADNDTLMTCSGVANDLNAQQDGHRASINAMSYSAVGSHPLTSCVKDNVTGLIWEGKEASGTRAGSNTYTSYHSAFYGTQAQMDAATNTYGYVAAVNAMALCGYTDWRLPTVDELQTIVDYSKPYPGPTINTTWFPNTPGSVYWASSPYVGNSGYAWVVYFNSGGVYSYLRYGVLHVRLVRASQ
jgi:hypothetical protein